MSDHGLRDRSAADEERAFVAAILEGLANVEAGREVSLHEARKRLDGGEPSAQG